MRISKKNIFAEWCNPHETANQLGVLILFPLWEPSEQCSKPPVIPLTVGQQRDSQFMHYHNSQSIEQQHIPGTNHQHSSTNHHLSMISIEFHLYHIFHSWNHVLLNPHYHQPGPGVLLNASPLLGWHKRAYEVGDCHGDQKPQTVSKVAHQQLRTSG